MANAIAGVSFYFCVHNDDDDDDDDDMDEDHEELFCAMLDPRKCTCSFSNWDHCCKFWSYDTLEPQSWNHSMKLCHDSHSTTVIDHWQKLKT